jgi:putative ABC transport system ATP-binding protein
MTYIVAESIWKKYNLGTHEIYALKGVSLSIGKGEAICILGPNGSGKTTLLKIIAGYIRPDSGIVHINGLDITKLDNNELTLFRKKYVGFIFQEDILIDSLSVYENLELGLKPYIKSRGERRDRIYNALDRLGIKSLVNRLYGKLSEGEKKRVSIAMAIATDPEILFADEPTSHLDEEGVNEVVNIINSLNKSGVTSLIATHDPLIANISKKRIMLRSGKVIRRI